MIGRHKPLSEAELTELLVKAGSAPLQFAERSRVLAAFMDIGNSGAALLAAVEATEFSGTDGELDILNAAIDSFRESMGAKS